MRSSRIGGLFASIVISAAIGGCTYFANVAYDENPLVDFPLLRHLHEKLGLEQVFIQVKDRRGRIMPADQYRFVVRVPNSDAIVLSPRDGYVPLPLSNHLRQVGAEIEFEWSGDFFVWPRNRTVQVEFVPFTISAIKSRVDGGLTPVWPGDMRRFDGVGFTVYYDEGCEAVAEEMRELMATVHQVIQDVLGLEPAPFGVAMMAKRSNYVTPAWPRGVPVFAFPARYEPELERHPIVMAAHEWAEHTLAERLDADGDDLRFVFDGLADLVAGISSGQWFCESPRSLERLAREGVEQVDLRVSFLRLRLDDETLLSSHRGLEGSMEAAGYPLSHLFWRRIADQHGASAIAEILRRWRDRGQLNADAVIDLVADVTADPSVRDAIERASVQDALAEFRQRGWFCQTRVDDHIYAMIDFR
jgi:hypothetical protein